jgi:hypothetical protein
MLEIATPVDEWLDGESNSKTPYGLVAPSFLFCGAARPPFMAVAWPPSQVGVARERWL